MRNKEKRALKLNTVTMTLCKNMSLQEFKEMFESQPGIIAYVV